eukprot:g8223.t1
MNGKAKPMRPSYVLQVLGVLMVLGGASGFASPPASIKPRPRTLALNAVTARDRAGGKAKSSAAAAARRPKPSPSSSSRQAPWLADLMTSWFNLALPKLSSLSGTSNTKATNRRYSSARDGIRAEILQLRVSNAELREEVGALRKSMVDRGYIPVEDIFAAATKAASSVEGDEASGRREPQQNSKNPPPPPPKLPREARLAALVALYGAAVAIGGVFVPIAIGVGASRSLRWLDEGGTVIPKRWRAGDGGRGQEVRRRRRWKDAVLSYVPVVARSRGRGSADFGDGAGGVTEDAGLVTAETLADAWDNMYPPRR